MDLWFIDNGCEDHLTIAKSSIPKDKCTKWKKTDALLCNILRQSIDTFFGIRRRNYTLMIFSVSTE